MYRWLENKQKGKIHEIDPATGTTYCKVENNGEHTRRRLSDISPNYPKDRKLCWCCKEIQRQRLYDETYGNLDQEFRGIMA